MPKQWHLRRLVDRETAKPDNGVRVLGGSLERSRIRWARSVGCDGPASGVARSRTEVVVEMAEIPEVFEGVLGCGHEGRVSLASVPIDKRFSRIAFLQEKGRCSACFAKANEKERAAEATASTRWAAEKGLPALRGSAKQVSFGEKVRRDLLVEAHQVLVEDGAWTEGRFATEVQEPAELVTSAHWWIEQSQVLAAMLPEVLVESEPMRARAWGEKVGAVSIAGTAGQVDWATRIRYEKVEAARRLLVPESMSAEQFAESVEGAAARINAARWWIDQAEAPAEVLPQLLEAAGHDAYIENEES